MTDDECVRFLQWALPRLHLSWRGFRRVRRQVCRRVERRCRGLGLPDLAAYRDYLEERPGEWAALDGLCRITISRFCRDRGAFAFLDQEVLPALAAGALAAGRGSLEVWSAGCASGEEPYTLAVMWELALAPRFPGLELRVVATDLDEAVLRRAREACYAESSLKELRGAWRDRAFVRRDGLYCLRPELARKVAFRSHDVRGEPPGGPFDLVLCRNLAFTYFDLELQRDVAGRLAGCLRPGGALVLGAHEAVPEGVAGLVRWPGTRGVYQVSAPAGR